MSKRLWIDSSSGASEIVAVPLFSAAPPSNLNSTVKSSVPIRVTPPMDADPVVADIVLGRALEISTNSAAEVLVVVSTAQRQAATNDGFLICQPPGSN